MLAPKQDLKCFGERFDGFPKFLPEDCVEYMLFIFDSRLNSQREILQQLELVRKASGILQAQLLKDYIWQRDSFGLELKLEAGPTYYLHGLTNYGDSVEDEWLIVYLLRELSRQFPELWIKVVDTDGEFLLIEAANVLPRWLNPEIANNRVWINKNSLKIIPLASSGSTEGPTAPTSRSLSLPEAQKIITEKADTLMHSPMVEAEAFYRLRAYPSQISASLHHAIVIIPRKLAHVLHECPSSIARATEVFYLRDPIALKPLQSSATSFTFPPVDLVSTSVRFTKVLYAQLKSQQFSPPISWKSVLQAAENDFATCTNKFERLEMGMKLTSGFEMMVIDPANRNNRSFREVQIILEELHENAAGDEAKMPTDEEIAGWPESSREDGESWLDINYEDFEKELQGKNDSKEPKIPGSFNPEEASGFGDAKTQADLKKMVQRFEDFLDDDKAGPEGVELDEMDHDDDADDDDDDEDDDEVDNEDEDKEVSFDETEFAKMMREMMGMPPEESDNSATSKVEEEFRKRKAVRPSHTTHEIDSDEDGSENDTEDIMRLMRGMEAELNEAGALDLDFNLGDAIQGKMSKGKEVSQQEHASDSDDGDVNIDFNLAKNLLESFKSQAGMAGPGGNLMGMMGMRFPRDEDDGSKLEEG